jgi:serine O-acetyltransferase
MIESKADYLAYLAADSKATQKTNKMTFKENIINLLYPNLVWKYQKELRILEYYKNCRKDLFGRIFYAWHYWKFHRLGYKLGFTMYPNCFGPGLDIVHHPGILVHTEARIGSNCRIYQGVTIGSSFDRNSRQGAIIGNHVWIGAGAKIMGDVTIADYIIIGANSVVTKSFLEPDITIAGIPAKKISNQGAKSRNLISPANSSLLVSNPDN